MCVTDRYVFNTTAGQGYIQLENVTSTDCMFHKQGSWDPCLTCIQTCTKLENKVVAVLFLQMLECFGLIPRQHSASPPFHLTNLTQCQQCDFRASATQYLKVLGIHHSQFVKDWDNEFIYSDEHFKASLILGNFLDSQNDYRLLFSCRCTWDSSLQKRRLVGLMTGAPLTKGLEKGAGSSLTKTLTITFLS